MSFRAQEDWLVLSGFPHHGNLGYPAPEQVLFWVRDRKPMFLHVMLFFPYCFANNMLTSQTMRIKVLGEKQSSSRSNRFN